MKQNHRTAHAALAVAGIALAVSIHTALRGPSDGSGDARPTGAGACTDREARDQLDRLRRVVAERDTLVARLAHGATMPVDPLPPVEPSQRHEEPPETGPRRYARFEIPNPAVSMTQKGDGTYEIRTTDPTLAGSVMPITAITQSGAEDKMLIRIP
jgi:hypothetical protein